MPTEDEKSVRPLGRKAVGRGRRLANAIYYLVAAAILIFGPLPGFLEAVFYDFDRDMDRPFSDPARGQYQSIKAHLESPFDGYGDLQVLVPQFAVVVLSHMACGLMNVVTVEPSLKEEVSPLLGEVVRRALSPQVSPYRTGLENVADLGSHGLYLSHLNLILGCYRHVSGDPQYDPLHHRISAHLAAGSLAAGDFHIRSYPDSGKWPAEQTVTLCSLFLYDQVHRTNLSAAPIRGWVSYIRDHATDPATQLPHSSISSFSYAPIPRGCALSWSALYMSQFAPDEAAQLYQRYRSTYARTILGCGGFREWPPERGEGADADSGPILFGIGVSASGLGIGPARLFHDYDQYTAIMRAASVWGLPKVWGRQRDYRLAPLLGEAILFHGVTATPWFGPTRTLAFDSQPSFPSGPVALALGAFLLVVYFLWRLWKLARG